MVGIGCALELEVFIQVQQQRMRQLRQVQGRDQRPMSEVEQDWKVVFRYNGRNIEKGGGHRNLGAMEVDFQL